jgi:hypothetical protein
MRLLGIIAAVAIGVASGSTALAQHGDHHGGGGGMGMGSGSEEMTMSCCDWSTDMCDPAACPGHKAKKDGKCDMSKCMGEMMGGMGDMMKDHHAGGMGDMGDMMNEHHAGEAGETMSGEKMKCCKQKKDNPNARAARNTRELPTLK